MASPFQQYTSGIAPVAGVSEAGANIGRFAQAGLASFGQSLSEGIQKYNQNSAENQMIDQEAQGLAGQYGQFLQTFGNSPEYRPFAEQLNQYVDRLAKIPEMSLAQKRGAINSAKVAFSQIGQQFQMFNAMKDVKEKNAMYGAGDEASRATDIVSQTVGTRANQIDPLKPYATQEIGVVNELEALQKRYPELNVDIPAQLELFRNQATEAARQISQTNPIGLKIIDQIEAARKVEGATSPDVEGYSEAEQRLATPAYVPTAEDIAQAQQAQQAQAQAQTAQGVPATAGTVAQTGVQPEQPILTEEKQRMETAGLLAKKVLPMLGSTGQVLAGSAGDALAAYLTSGGAKKSNTVSAEQLNKMKELGVGDVVSTASKMGYPAYAALALGAQALGQKQAQTGQVQPEQPSIAQAQPASMEVQPTTQPSAQAKTPAIRPSGAPVLNVPKREVGMVQKAVPMSEEGKHQEFLKLFSKKMGLGTDSQGNQIIAPQAERMFRSLVPEQPKVVNLKDAQGNDYSVLSTTDKEGKTTYKSISPIKKEGASVSDQKLAEASTYGILDPKTGELQYEQPIKSLNVMVRGKGKFSTTEKAEKFKELLASSSIVIKSMNRVREIAKENPYWAKAPYSIAGKEMVNEQSKAISMLGKSLGLDRLSDKDVQIIMERIPQGDSVWKQTPDQTIFMANQIIKDVNDLIASSGEVHGLDVIVPDSISAKPNTDFRKTDARNALLGIPPK
ncbi:hypothetical protein CCP3SC1AL1_400016 [Gammaproteobacteria bacterium]